MAPCFGGCPGHLTAASLPLSHSSTGCMQIKDVHTCINIASRCTLSLTHGTCSPCGVSAPPGSDHRDVRRRPVRGAVGLRPARRSRGSVGVRRRHGGFLTGSCRTQSGCPVLFFSEKVWLVFGLLALCWDCVVFNEVTLSSRLISAFM